MGMPMEKLESEALGLSPGERARLALRLIQSLDDECEDPAEVERAWEKEIQSRLTEYHSGRTQAIPAADVFAEARRRLQ